MGKSSKMTSFAPINFGREYDQAKMRGLENQVREQADAIRRLERMLMGGTTGQVLAKTGNRDLEGTWTDP